MRYNIVFKFLALLICAAMLLCTVGTALGIFALNEAGLYRQSYDSAYSDYRQTRLQQCADGIVARYAATELGGLTDRMADEYYGYSWYLDQFRHGTMGYTLYDSEKKPVQTYDAISREVVERVFVSATQQLYPKSAAILSKENWNEIQGITEPTEVTADYVMIGNARLYDAVPSTGVEVHRITVGYPDSSEGIGSPDSLGKIWHDENGFVVFKSYEPNILDVSRRSELNAILFENEELGVVFELASPEGIGLLYSDPDGYINFQAGVVNAVPEATQPMEATAAPTELYLEYNGFSTGANIYSAPQTDAPVTGRVEEADFGLEWREYSVEGALWYMSEKGWVKAEPVYAAEAQDTAPADAARTVSGTVLPADTLVYSVPNLESAPLHTLPAGTQLEIIRTVSVEGAGWILVPEGWIPEASLVETAEAALAPTEETIPVEATEAALVPTEETIRAEAAESSAPTEEDLPRETTETTAVPTEEMISGETAPEAAAAAVTEASAAPAAEEFETEPAPVDAKYLTYYDSEEKREMVLQYTLEECPAFTVEFHLAEDALEGDFVWSLLGFAYRLRNYLVPALLGSALLFVIFFIYLCLAAGRKAGTDVVRPEGLNRVPIDVYFVIVCCGIMAAIALGMEGSQYLMNGSMAVGTAFAAALGYGASLMIVGFCFAFAAQVKTPGGFWWKHSVCGLSLRLVKLCWRWVGKGIGWLAGILKNYVFPLTRRILRAGWKFGCVMVAFALQWMKTLLGWLKKLCARLSAGFLRMWQLLPMTWQWLLTGFFIIFLLAMTVNVPGLAFWGICGTIAIVLYGTHAYGTLLEGVKHMNKGDLDNKVDDKFLIGSFREFAEELNGLADVAVVAAQKQLKSERMRTELITNVSHDIKTPLTSIINYVDLMKLPHSEETQEQYLEVLSRQSLRLKKLIDDLMELSKASTGNMQVEITTVDAVEAVNQALGEFADKLERADLQPVFRQSGDRLLMYADGRLLWRVLSNILGNAVKYAQPGTRLYIDVADVEGKVIISMKNISREELNVSADELMERFVRGDTSRNTEGSGLGLNIAQSLMQLQKGSLQLLVDGDLFKVTLIFPGA